MIRAEDLTELYVFHKPGFRKDGSQGCISSFSLNLSAHEGLSLRDYFMQEGLDRQFPMDEMVCFGRLDKDTSGLLLLSKKNHYPKFLDQLLLNPHYKKDPQKTMKVYHAKVNGVVVTEKLKELRTIRISSKQASWVDVHAKNTRLISVSHAERSASFSQVEVEIDEGKHHQVKKMLYAIGHPVHKGGLHRTRLGIFTLQVSDQEDAGELGEGQIRSLFLREKNWLVELYNEWLSGERERLQLH